MLNIEIHNNSLYYNNKYYTGINQLSKLCRDLLTQGYTGELQLIRNNQIVGVLKDISGRAKLDLTENDKGFRMVKSRAYPMR